MNRELGSPISYAIIFGLGSTLLLAQGAPKKLSNGGSLNTLTQGEWTRIENGGGFLTLQLDLLLLRQKPSLLDDKKNMGFFAMVNACGSRDSSYVRQALNNELEYPNISSYYKERAPDILRIIPDSFTIGIPSIPNPVNKQYQISLQLGEYDATKHSFPFVDGQNKRVTIQLDNVTPGIVGATLCQDTLPAQFMIRFKPLRISDFPIDEGAAQKYLSSAGVGAAGIGRGVVLLLEIEVLQETPDIRADQRTPGGILVTMSGKLNKITVADLGNRPIRTLVP